MSSLNLSPTDTNGGTGCDSTTRRLLEVFFFCIHKEMVITKIIFLRVTDGIIDYEAKVL